METKEKTRRPAAKKQASAKKNQAAPGADVVYLPPKPFSRNRLILHLVTVGAVVLAVVLGLSIFFKVDSEKITITGADKYTAWEIAQASGLKDGENLITFNRARTAWKIKNALPYIRDVRIGIQLPDTVKIEVVEVSVTYAVKDVNETDWWLVSSDGRIVEQTDETSAENVTKILGVKLEGAKVGEEAAAYQEPQTATDANGVLLPITVKASEKLQTALDIAGFLESNGIIGQMESIDVNDLFDIQLWYGSQYQVKLGDYLKLMEKIVCLKATLEQSLSPHNSGVLDITTPPKVVYTEF